MIAAPGNGLGLGMRSNSTGKMSYTILSPARPTLSYVSSGFRQSLQVDVIFARGQFRDELD